MGQEEHLAIRTEHLTKSFGTSRGIVDVNIEVKRGEVFGLLGPNGAGKTTLLRCLVDLIRPTSGRIQILGHHGKSKDVRIRQHVGYLPGEFSLWPGLNPQQTLSRLLNLRTGIEPDRVTALAQRLNLDMTRPISQMSRGNKQKVGLVLALAPVADLYILDEPTGGLDPLIQQQFRELVQEEVGRGATILLSSHVLHEVEHLADRIAVLRAGELVAVERVDELRLKAARPVTVTFSGVAPLASLEKIPGVSIALCDAENSVSLRVKGPIDGLIKFLATQEVVSLVAPEAELDEIFLDFYGDPAGQ